MLFGYIDLCVNYVYIIFLMMVFYEKADISECSIPSGAKASRHWMFNVLPVMSGEFCGTLHDVKWLISDKVDRI